jgi:catecholate siderophore receptor
MLVTTTSRKAVLLATTALACAAGLTSSLTPALAQDPTALGSVRVEGDAKPGSNPYADPDARYKADHLSSSKFAEPILNTPKTVTVLTKEILEDKNVTSLRDAVRETPGVTLGTGEGGNAFGDRFFIRGFDARNDVFVDGIRDPGVLVRENYNTEQIEILKGPASSYAGRGTTGGALNVVTKRATADYDFYNAQATGGFLDNNKRLTIDVNQTLLPNLAVRVNGVVQESDIAGRDFATDNRRGIAGAVFWQPLEELTVNASYSYTNVYGRPDFGVPFNTVLHRPVTQGGVPRETYYGAINRDFTKSKQSTGTLYVAWKPFDWLTVENNFRTGHSLLNYIGTIPENPGAAGATAPFSNVASLTAPKYTGYTQLNAQSRYEPVTTVADQLQASAKFNWGAIDHTVMLGVETSTEHLTYDTYTGLTSELTTGLAAFASNGSPVTTVINPVHTVLTASKPVLTGNPLRYRVATNSAFFMDTANYKDELIINWGVRLDNYRINSANNTSNRAATNGITSYNLGIVYKPVQEVSLYGALSSSANPVGSEIDANSSAYGGLPPTQPTTQIYGPQRSKAYELGMKWALFDQHLLATAAVFQTSVSNARETAPAGLAGFTSGAVFAGASYSVKGLEFGLAGNITEDWSVSAGAVFMNPRVDYSIVPTNIGLRLANIANQSFNLLSKYQINPWLDTGGQVNANGPIRGGSLLSANGGVAYPTLPNNPTILPPTVSIDLFGQAKITDYLSVKLYGANILDRTNYTSLYQSVVPFVGVAPGRTVSIIADLKL